jgi:UDP-3-O-[3-hydroxymyristoyl] N-acetylglucosamine deacetylase
MTACRQRTIASAVEVSGFGLFGGADCRLVFHPADEYAGIAFRRVDLAGSRPVPATVDFVKKVPRRTAISDGRSTIETIEHVMAALAGLGIDNCLVELDAVEPPIGDGSSFLFVSALLRAGVVEQSAKPVIISANRPHRNDADGGQSIDAEAASDFGIRYSLDYGAHSPIGLQSVFSVITPETFVREIAGARTFVAASEIEGLRKMGFGLRATTENLLVFTDEGVLDNSLRWPDECARHKLLDAIGDLALCGGRVQGRFHAVKSGHHLNHEMARTLKTQFDSNAHAVRRAA